MFELKIYSDLFNCHSCVLRHTRAGGYLTQQGRDFRLRGNDEENSFQSKHNQ